VCPWAGVNGPSYRCWIHWHSPIIASTPGAEIIELGPHGLRRTAWEELEIVGRWRIYLRDPQSYLHPFITTP
jgi:predicted ATPase